MFSLRKTIARFMLLGIMCLSLGLMVSNGFAEETTAKWECQSCEYSAGLLELCKWNKPPSGECGEKPYNAYCQSVESCPPIEPE